MPGLARFHIFQALFRSRVCYAINLLAPTCPRITSWYKGFYYRALKKLLRIKDLVNKDKILELCLGKKFEEFMMGETSNTYAILLNKAANNDERLSQLDLILRHFHIEPPANEEG